MTSFCGGAMQSSAASVGGTHDIWGEEEAMEAYLKAQEPVAENRERYRRGKKDTAVKAYTILDESRYVIVRNLPAVGAHKELLAKFALYGPIEEWRMLDLTEAEDFKEVMWIKFQSVENAKTAKRSLDDSIFYSHPLFIAYAPEYETEQETWQKLQLRKFAVTSRLEEIRSAGERPPERGKRPRHVDRTVNVPPPISRDILPFAAPRVERSNSELLIPAAAAAAAKRPHFDGSFEASRALVQQRLQKLNPPPAPSAQPPPPDHELDVAPMPATLQPRNNKKKRLVSKSTPRQRI